MAELNNIKRLRETLEEYAKIEVPDDLDPWAKMHSRLVGITPSTGKIESARLDADKKLSSARRRGERRMLRPGFSMLPIMIVGVTLLMLGVFAATRVAEPGASKGYEFVPVGMVRHLVVNSRQVGLGPDPEKSDVGAPITSTIEVWFANAPKDYLIRTHFAHYNGPGEPKISEGWELNDMLYIADPEEKIVLWLTAGMYAIGLAYYFGYARWRLQHSAPEEIAARQALEGFGADETSSSARR